MKISKVRRKESPGSKKDPLAGTKKKTQDGVRDLSRDRDPDEKKPNPASNAGVKTRKQSERRWKKKTI